MLIHVHLQLPAAQAQTNTSYSLFNKLVKKNSELNSEVTGSYKQKSVYAMHALQSTPSDDCCFHN